MNIDRRLVAIATWCRELWIPAVVFVVLLVASSPANDVYSLAAADVTPATADVTAAVSAPLSGEVVTATIDPPASPEAAVPETDTPDEVAPAINAPVLAALDAPDEKLPAARLEESGHRNDIAGPKVEEIYDAINAIEIVDECLIMEICVDRFLWQLYQRTPKEDSVKESTVRWVTIKRKRKLVTVKRTTTIVVDEDFGWKDPKAAKNARMSLAEYVIGGVDKNFKLRLFQMLHAADQAGLAPGITSGFRDDYRQSIASGLKAADNRSYHGGSLRGGYGHGLAADIVSTRGATRGDRLRSSEVLWKWVDDHGAEFGLGRPYLDRDPPHVAPVDGEEYAHHRPGKARHAAAN